MSGHSKWSSIKHKKGALDAKRGKLFTRIQREVTVAARMGGGDPDANPRLRSAIQAAKDANMPKDTMERAIARGSGELPGVTFEDFSFEGYGQAGVAIMVEGTTDNRNRTTPEIRHIFTKYGGNLGENGCVAWMFHKKGLIHVSSEGQDEDAVMEAALEAGAEDFDSEDGAFLVTTGPEDYFSVRQGIEAKGFKVESGGLEFIPENTIKVEGREAEKLLRLITALEDQDDVSSVAANYEIDPEILAQLSG